MRSKLLEMALTGGLSILEIPEREEVICMDYLHLAFLIGYTAGKQRKEFTPCQSDH